MTRAEGVAWILPFGDGCYFESLGKFGRKVFQRVHGEIDFSCGEGFFDFFGEHALRPNLCEGNVGDLVAGGVNDVDLDLMSTRAQESGNVVCLPEGELGTAGADAKGRH